MSMTTHEFDVFFPQVSASGEWQGKVWLLLDVGKMLWFDTALEALLWLNEHPV